MMKMQEAMAIIDKVEGYMVHFELAEGGMLSTDYFPDKHAGEPLIKTEDEAWCLAKKFAEKTKGKCVNIYIVSNDHYPVPDYKNRTISNR